MKIRASIVVLALACLSGYVITIWSPRARESRILQPSPLVPAELAALSGVWETIGAAHIPTRLVVENVHDQWATILLAWGDHPEGKFASGSLRAKAKVMPDGRLFWRQLGEFTFQLSDDWNTIVAKQDQGSREAVVLLRRVPSDAPLGTLTAKAKE